METIGTLKQCGPSLAMGLETPGTEDCALRAGNPGTARVPAKWASCQVLTWGLDWGLGLLVPLLKFMGRV